MKVVLLEPLEISDDKLKEFKEQIEDAGHEFKSYQEKTTEPDELYERSKDADIVIIANNPYPAEVIEKLENTKLIQVAFTGLDHVGLEAANKKDILVQNAAGYSDNAVAELVIGHTLALLRKIPWADSHTRNGGDAKGLIGREIKGKTVGIIGTGNIGIETAKLFKAFGANLVGCSRSEKQEALDLGLKYYELDEMLKRSDIVSVHLPLNDETKNYLSAHEFEVIKDGALLINCARGPIVDTTALVDALENGKLAGCAIDVFETEPPLAEDHPLLSSYNTILSPHLAYYTKEAMLRRAEIVLDRVLEFLSKAK